MDKQQFFNVQALLEIRGCTHLSDSLEFLPHENIEAVANMAEDLIERDQSATEVAARVEHDIAGFLTSEKGFKPYCAAWLKLAVVLMVCLSFFTACKTQTLVQPNYTLPDSIGTTTLALLFLIGFFMGVFCGIILTKKEHHEKR